MARYFFHLESREGTLRDPEGSQHLSLEDAVRHGLAQARSIISYDAGAGQLDLAQSIIISDRRGTAIKELPFRLAFDFRHEGDGEQASKCPALARLAVGLGIGPNADEAAPTA